MTGKLALNETLYKIDDAFCQILANQYLNIGNISVPYLMRKLKCTASEAKRIREQYLEGTK